MLKSLMQGVNEKDMQAIANSFNLRDFYYPTLFPIKKNISMTWKGLERQAGLRIAGDIVARGANLDQKSREALTRLQGDIPKVAIKRIKDENELNEYNILVAMTQGNQDLRSLIDAWAEDMKFCYTGVAARLEWTALKSISLGKIKLDNDNNVGPLSEFDVDYLIPSGHKAGFKAATWDNSTDAKPITQDFRQIVKAARKEGIYLKYVFMSLNTWAKFADCDEVKKIAASFAQNVLGVAFTPTVDQVNTALRSLAYLYGLQIVVIDQEISIEKKDGSIETGNPFEDDVCTFTESSVLGNTFYVEPADYKIQSPSYKVLTGHTLIKKYSTEEPLTEVTIGTANAFPAWFGSGRSYLLDTANSTWKH